MPNRSQDWFARAVARRGTRLFRPRRVVRETPTPFERRALEWDLTSLPVSADLLVYSEAEWKTIVRSGGRFARVLTEEARWVLGSSA